MHGAAVSPSLTLLGCGYLLLTNKQGGKSSFWFPPLLPTIFGSAKFEWGVGGGGGVTALPSHG